MNLADRIVDVLSIYLPKADAQALLQRSLRSIGAAGQPVNERNLPVVLQRVQASALLFVAHDGRAALQADLARLREQHGGALPKQSAETVPIRAETDIVVARTRARMMCEALACGSVAAHKIATVVSELARNIVSYTQGGTIELIPGGNPPSITIRAVDRGPGIHNLDAIMNGSYRSKTGLGLGLAGSKRLASHFEIDTGPNGTTVLVRMRT